MTEKVARLKFHTWRPSLGQDKNDSKKFVRKGPRRELTDMLGRFQGCQCIYIYFLDLQNLFHDLKSPRTEVTQMGAPLGLGHA